MSYYDQDQDERIDYTIIEERTVRARQARPCGDHLIETGEVYMRRAALVDGDFDVTCICLHCDNGHPRPGSAEEAEMIADALRATQEDEADYLASIDGR